MSGVIRHKLQPSLEFFSKRGHKTILAGYYDSADVKANVAGWREAASKVPGVGGLIYTTWRNEYKDLEAFARFATQP